MSATATEQRPRARSRPTTDATRGDAGSARPRPRSRGPRTDTSTLLFRIPFRSAMAAEDANRLRHAIGMHLHLDRKHPAVAPPLGVAELDPGSALYLVRGEGEDEWVLEGRTWGAPAPGVVRGWKLKASLAARALDPSAPPPQPLPAAERSGRRTPLNAA